MVNIRVELTTQIEQMQMLLEDVYVGIGREFGLLRESMDLQLERSLSVVTDYKKRVVSDKDSLFGTIKGVESVIEQSIENYEGMDRDSDQLVSVFKESFREIREIMEQIREIRDSSELMEVLSLNAMVVAIQSGKNGGGFTFISDALKNTASSTIRLSDEVLAAGDQLSQSYDRVNNMLESIVFLNSDLKTFFSKTIQYQFQQFYSLSENYIESVEELYSAALKVKKPVSNIMQDLQAQDILRQSLDHITLFIKELPTYGGEGQEDELDELAIIDLINEFAIEILSEVRDNIYNNLASFRERIESIKSITATVKGLRSSFLDKHGEDSSVEDNMQNVIEEFRNGMVSLLQDLNEGERIRSDLKQEESRLFTMVANLSKKASGFESLTTVFRSIILLGRIEISKLEALRGVEISMLDISDNTDSIDNSLDQIKEHYTNITVFDQQIQELFTVLFSSESSRTINLAGQFNSLEAMLNESYQGLLGIVSGFSFFSDQLSEMAGLTMGKVERLSGLINTIDEQLKSCKELDFDVKRERSKIFQSMGINKWDLRFTGIDSIIAKFTVYRHRKNARNLSGIEESHSALKEGEITFF